MDLCGLLFIIRKENIKRVVLFMQYLKHQAFCIQAY